MSLTINRNTLERCGQNLSSLQSNIQKYDLASVIICFISLTFGHFFCDLFRYRFRCL